MSRNVSGSLLPSSDPTILREIPTKFGPLQVRVIPDLDCHGLFHRYEHGWSLLATHGNGYSLHELAKRLVAGDDTRTRAQAQYILDCGGTCRHLDHICTTSRLPRPRPARTAA